MRTLRSLQFLLALCFTLTLGMSGSCLATFSPQASGVAPQSLVFQVSNNAAKSCCCPDPVKMQREMPCCAELKMAHESATFPSTANFSHLRQTVCGCAFTPQSPTRGPTQEGTRFLIVEASLATSYSVPFLFSRSEEGVSFRTSVLSLHRTAFALLPSRAPPVSA